MSATKQQCSELLNSLKEDMKPEDYQAVKYKIENADPFELDYILFSLRFHIFPSKEK